MPGMLNILARSFPDLRDPERLYSVNTEFVVCTNVFGPRMCYPDNADDGEMCYSVRVVTHDLPLYVGKFRTLEEAEEKHKELSFKIDYSLRWGSYRG